MTFVAALVESLGVEATGFRILVNTAGLIFMGLIVLSFLLSGSVISKPEAILKEKFHIVKTNYSNILLGAVRFCGMTKIRVQNHLFRAAICASLSR